MPNLGISAPLKGWPFYTGFPTTKKVPWQWHVAIAGHTYMIEPSLYERQTIDRLRPYSSDAEAEPGEQTLSTHGPWRRHGRRWDHGAGQLFFDKHDSDRLRYQSSKGIDTLSVPDQLTLLKDTRNIYSTAGTSLGVLAVAGFFYYYDGSALKWTANPAVASPAWTDSGVTHPVFSITTDGNNVYAALGAFGIDKTVAGSAARSQLSTQAATLVGYANGQLLAANANVLYSIAANGTATTVFTHTNPNVTFVAIIPGPTGVFVALNNGDAGEFLFVGFNATTGALAAPVAAGMLPQGETANAMVFYGGLVLIGTSVGLKLAQIISNVGLSTGPSIPIPGGVKAFSLQGEFAWFTWTNYDGTSTGLGRADLSVFTEALVPAYASDLMATAQGNVLSVATFGGRRYFMVSGLGLYAEHPTQLVLQGTINSGWMDFGTSEQKVAISMDMRHAPLNGSVDVNIAKDDLTVLACGSSMVAGTLGPNQGLGIPTTTNELYEVRLNLNRGTDVTTGPLLKRWTFRAIPSPARVDQFTVPIILREKVYIGAEDTSTEQAMDVAGELLFLKAKEANGLPIKYQEGNNTYTCVIENIVLPPDESRRWTDKRDALEGICKVQLITLAATGQ